MLANALGMLLGRPASSLALTGFDPGNTTLAGAPLATETGLQTQMATAPALITPGALTATTGAGTESTLETAGRVSLALPPPPADRTATRMWTSDEQDGCKGQCEEAPDLAAQAENDERRLRDAIKESRQAKKETAKKMQGFALERKQGEGSLASSKTQSERLAQGVYLASEAPIRCARLAFPLARGCETPTRPIGKRKECTIGGLLGRWESVHVLDKEIISSDASGGRQGGRMCAMGIPWWSCRGMEARVGSHRRGALALRLQAF